jgi:hypothetical protein
MFKVLNIRVQARVTLDQPFRGLRARDPGQPSTQLLLNTHNGYADWPVRCVEPTFEDFRWMAFISQHN